MSETPISLVDDKNQVTYNADQILNDREAQRAFFEHAETGKLYSPAPPEFEAFELKDEAPVIDQTLWTQPESGFVQPPEFAQPALSREEEMEETISHFKDLECVKAIGSISTAAVLLRRLN